MHIVRTIDVVALRVPLVQVDASEVDHPQQRRRIVDDGKVDDVARVVLDGARANPVGLGVGARFMKKKEPAAPCG